MKYAVVIERGRGVMGRVCLICRVAWRLGRRKGKVCGLIREALEEDGQAVPAPGVYELIGVQGV